MITLKGYLDNIAKAILEPVGKYYWYVGDIDGTVSYSGVHRCNSGDSLWKDWTLLSTVEVQLSGSNEATTYGLYWTKQEDDGAQGSWWVEMVPAQ